MMPCVGVGVGDDDDDDGVEEVEGGVVIGGDDDDDGGAVGVGKGPQMEFRMLPSTLPMEEASAESVSTEYQDSKVAETPATIERM